MGSMQLTPVPGGTSNLFAMNFFYWNVRGIGNFNSRVTLRPLLLLFREGNCCADELANMGHGIQGSVWLTTLPPQLCFDFF
jgi:hypothetical protein